MSKNSHGSRLDDMPEAFVSDTSLSRQVSKAVKAGKLRKLGSRLYTSNMTDPPEAIVRRNLWGIVTGYFPGALIADRTALENEPAPDGSVCLVTESGRNIDLPGHTLRPRRGEGPLSSDRPFVGDLFLSSIARAYLENLRPRRARAGHVARTLSRSEIEERLEALLRHSGAAAANRLRDEIRTIAPQLAMEKEADDLDNLIGALQGTRDVELSAPATVARRRGRPYDPDRLELFEALHSALRNQAPTIRAAHDRPAADTATLAFFEAYFSNYIEGTAFEVEDAASIVFDGVIPADRPEDAHDVLGTWWIVSNAREMSRTPKDAVELEKLLRARHFRIMEQRPGKRPGEYKLKENRAGSTSFVAPELVAGTLEQGFGFYRSLETAFQRAVFIMFLVAEVHPFTDGNGRTARIMMNAELVAAGEERIVIPTVFRGEYLSALKALSHNTRPDPLIHTLDYAQRWTSAMPWHTVEATRRALDACNAFLDSIEAEQEGARLRMPGEEAT